MIRSMFKFVVLLVVCWYVAGAFCDWVFSTSPNRLYAWVHRVRAVPIHNPEFNQSL